MFHVPRVTDQLGGRPGHTLTEMLVALAILGVIAGAVVPTLLPARDEDGVTRTARALVELLNDSRETAAEQGAVVTLVVDPETGRAWTSAGDDDAFTEASGATSLVESLAQLRHAGAPVAISASDRRASWTFAPSGLAFGEPVVISDPTRTVQVRVDRWTGEVHAQRR